MQPVHVHTFDGGQKFVRDATRRPARKPDAAELDRVGVGRVELDENVTDAFGVAADAEVQAIGRAGQFLMTVAVVGLFIGAPRKRVGSTSHNPAEPS